MVGFLTAVTLASGAMQVGQNIQAGMQAEEQAEYNAALQMIQAEESRAWAEYDEARLREIQEFNRSQMLVDLLRNGGTIEEGTAGDMILREQEIQDEMEALTIRRRADSEFS